MSVIVRSMGLRLVDTIVIVLALERSLRLALAPRAKMHCAAGSGTVTNMQVAWDGRNGHSKPPFIFKPALLYTYARVADSNVQRLSTARALHRLIAVRGSAHQMLILVKHWGGHMIAVR